MRREEIIPEGTDVENRSRTQCLKRKNSFMRLKKSKFETEELLDAIEKMNLKRKNFSTQLKTMSTEKLLDAVEKNEEDTELLDAVEKNEEDKSAARSKLLTRVIMKPKSRDAVNLLNYVKRRL